MTAAIIDAFRDNGLFWQSPESVAKIVLGLMTNEEVNGKAVYVEGGDGFEFEDGLYAAQPQWLGEEATRRLRANTEAVQKVSLVASIRDHSLTIFHRAFLCRRSNCKKTSSQNFAGCRWQALDTPATANIGRQSVEFRMEDLTHLLTPSKVTVVHFLPA